MRFLLSGSGTVVEQYAYDAFGAATITDGNGANPHFASNYGNRLMYKGRDYLSALGIYDFRKRVYHAGLGRFFQVDPKGFEGGDPHNLFRFCMHNPLTGNDPMGEDLSLGSTDPFAFGAYGFADPFGFLYLSAFDVGAFDTPIPDPTANSPFGPGYTVGGSPGTSTAPMSDFGRIPSFQPSAGSGVTVQPPSQATDLNIGTGVTSPGPTINFPKLAPAQPIGAASAGDYLGGWANGFGLFGRWITGTGPQQRNYGSDSIEARMMQNAPGVQTAVARYWWNNTGITDWTDASSVRYQAPFGAAGAKAAGINPTQHFVGGYTAYVNGSGPNAVQITIWNQTSMQSFLLDSKRIEYYDRSTFPIGGNMNQTVTFRLPYP